MPELKIESAPSRNLESGRVYYYVKNTQGHQITKFSTDTQKAEDIEGWDNFTPAQQLELQNYLMNVRFVVDKIQLPARLNQIYRLFLPGPLQTVLIELFERSQKNNIIFDPLSAMLNGLLDHITITEKQLTTKGEGSVLEQSNIKIKHDDKTEQHRETRKYTKKLFKRLLVMPNGLEKYAKIAHSLYDKETDLNSSVIVKYAEGRSRPSQWSISCTLTVLGHEKENITELLPTPLLVSLWLTPLKFLGKLTTTEQAIDLFETTFKLDKKANQEAIPIIQHEMIKPT